MDEGGATTSIWKSECNCRMNKSIHSDNSLRNKDDLQRCSFLDHCCNVACHFDEKKIEHDVGPLLLLVSYKYASQRSSSSRWDDDDEAAKKYRCCWKKSICLE